MWVRILTGIKMEKAMLNFEDYNLYVGVGILLSNKEADIYSCAGDMAQ